MEQRSISVDLKNFNCYSIMDYWFMENIAKKAIVNITLDYIVEDIAINKNAHSVFEMV